MVKRYKTMFSLLASAVAAGLLAAPAVSHAGTVMTSTGKETKNLIEETKESCISGDLGVTFVTAYISRGLVQEDEGVIAQPYLDIYFKLYEGDGFINKVTAGLGFWASIHENETFASPGSTTPAWYEFDWMPSIGITFAKNFTLTTSYYEFDSPNDAFASFRGVNVSLAYDDTDLLGLFALHPKFTVLFELENKAGIGPDKGVYYEIAIAPGHTFMEESAYPVTVTIPVVAGFGSDGFYAGDTFGFVSAGITASVGLGFIPECFGSWSLAAGGLYYHLGDNAADYTNGGETDKFVGTATLGMTF
jgi:hypothetical protein